MQRQSDSRNAALSKEAGRLLEQALDDPASTMREVDQLLEKDLSPEAKAVALRAAGLAARSVRSIADSTMLLRRSVAAAKQGENQLLVAEAELSLSGSLALSGDLTGALSLLDQTRQIPETLAARFAFQRATILARTGRAVEAEAEFDRALERFRANGDFQFESQTLANRGRLRMEVGQLDGAELDLRAAHSAYQNLGQEALGAWVLHNLGDLAASKGDLIGALRDLEASQQVLQRVTETPWEGQVTLGETLLSAGLLEETVQLTSLLDRLMTEAGFELERAEVLLLRSRALLIGGQTDEANTAATLASDLFRTQRRSVWAMKADLMEIRTAKPDEVSQDRHLGVRAFELADGFDKQGSALAATEAQAEGVIRLARAGEVDSAMERLPLLKAAAKGGHIERHLLCLYAEAFVQAAAKNRRAALRAISSALRVSERYRLSLGALELSLSGANHTALLLELGKKLASESADNRVLFRWSEFGRARTLVRREIQPPADDETAAAYRNVRRLAKQLDTSDESGRSQLSAAYATASRRLRSAERQRGRKPGVVKPDPVAPLVNVRSALGNRQLVSLVNIEGQMIAQIIGPQRTVRQRLGKTRDWVQSFRLLRRRLDGLVQEVSGAKTDIDRIRRQLSREFAPVISSDREIVLIPPVELFDAPWGALEQLADLAFVVSPSATSWARDHHEAQKPLEALSVAGPGLANASSEAERVSQAYEESVLLTDNQATVQRVLDSLPLVRVAHIVCHGQHRRGNALFSSLLLHDGPLPALELERLASAPELVVLSSCMAAGADTIGGSELLGLTSIFLRVGADCVLAGNGLVLDSEVTVDLMARFHERLRAGTSPAVALLESRPADPTDRLLTSSGFHVYGRSR